MTQGKLLAFEIMLKECDAHFGQETATCIVHIRFININLCVKKFIITAGGSGEETKYRLTINVCTFAALFTVYIRVYT